MKCACGSTNHEDTGYQHVECIQCHNPSTDCYVCVSCFYKNVEKKQYWKNSHKHIMETMAK